MFVRKKVQHGWSAYYLVENRREDGKVRQKVLAYLGPAKTPAYIGTCDSLEHAIAYWEKCANNHRQWLERFNRSESTRVGNIQIHSENRTRDAERFRALLARTEERIVYLKKLLDIAEKQKKRRPIHKRQQTFSEHDLEPRPFPRLRRDARTVTRVSGLVQASTKRRAARL